MTIVGLSIPPELSYESWERAGRKLSSIVDSSAWWLGDWLVYGKANYANRYKYAIQAVGLRYQTLRNYAWVARRFEMSRRRATLTFQHHAEVASLPVQEQNELLDQAERRSLSTKQLRDITRDRQGVEPEVAPAQTASSRIAVPENHVITWRKAADLVGMPFDSWVLSNLDRIAEQTLHEELRADA
ncbi:MAG TPA: LmbU family transcriptional regulator [Actinoplanes sp.]